MITIGQPSATAHMIDPQHRPEPGARGVGSGDLGHGATGGLGCMRASSAVSVRGTLRHLPPVGRGIVAFMVPSQVDTPYSGLTIRLLGPVEVLVGETPLRVDTRKAVALLAYLAVTSRPTSREALAALLWPESADSEARGALRRTLSVLNSGLGGVGLTITRTTVALDAAVVRLDLDGFRSTVASARSHGHPPGQGCPSCRAALEDSLAVARGPFMEGFAVRDSDAFDEWLGAEREAYQRELAGALERLVGEQLAAGAWDAAISAGRRWLELDQLHEPAHRALMEAYARSGETAAAVRQYRDVAAVLDRELGVVPLPETTELSEAILAGSLAARPGSTTSHSTPAAGSPGGALRRPPLIGREGELARVVEVLDTATPDGRLVVIEGEAGVGKTRLADRVVEVANANGHAVVEARCYAGETGIALGPIVALLRARLASADGAPALASLPARTRATLSVLLPEIELGPRAAAAANQPGPAARLELFEAIADGLTAAMPSQPSTAVVVRLDDLQWADDSTLEVLAFIARRLERRAAALLLSWRREELDERAAPIVSELVPPAGTLVRLGRLDPTDTRSLVTALVSAGRAEPSPVVVDRLVEEAEGLPLYVVEALATGDRPVGAVPAGIRALLQARLAVLSDVAAQVVAAAAVIGRSFDIETARQVSGRSDDETVAALEELVRRGIAHEAVGDDTVQYDFAHARLRDVAYETTSVARRRLLHRRAAEAYRAQGTADGDQLGRLARVARHEREAGRSSRAAQAFREAGELARRVFANRDALRYLEAALALGHPDTADILEAIADVRTRTGDYPGAIAALEMAAASASPTRLAGIEHRVGRIHLRRGDPVAADAHLTAALSALDAAETAPGPARSSILADQAIVAARAGEPQRAASLASEARQLADGDLRAQVEADRILGLLARERGDTVAARTALERSLSGSADLADPVPSIAATNALSLLAADEGQADRAITLAETALAIAQRTGERHLEAALENNLADALEMAGRREEAMAHLKSAAAAFADIGRTTDELEPGIWMLESW